MDREWWAADAEEHYRELAGWLRAIAAKCRLPNPQRELLILARRYEHRAEYFAEQSGSG
jgi:hypothetical protein